MAKDNTVDLVIGLAVLGGAAWAISQGWLGKAVDALLNLKLPDLGGVLGGGGGSTGGGGDTNTGGGGGSTISGDSFASFADVGSARNSNWKASVAQMAKLKPAAVLVAGDLSYGSPSAFKPVTDAIKAFGAKVYGAMGNHDSSGDKANFDGFSNSIVNIGQMSVMLLDTESGSASVSYARTNLSKMTGKFKIVVFHKPIYTSQSNHAPDEGKIGALVPDFEKAGIKLVLAGHNHNYQRFAPKNGVTYVVVGTGGESHYSLKGTGSGIVKQDSGNFGFLYGQLVNSTMQCKFISSSGSVIDSFSV